MAEQENTSFRRWTEDEDEALRQAVAEFRGRNWKAISGRVPNRDHQQCRQRWYQVLAPNIVKGTWSVDEDELLTSLMQKQPIGQEVDWAALSENINGRK
ncbi:hypothetical protein THRCLA_08766 [Thraustotheca clavata]|uniref:Myb-like DNA-binding protein n=1 Tax=Thraustotheca clavata TaxID=74557 RepID=A0A1V9Z2H1_9STRA|nr:hypothetical protein THRCLA_08766 [Thraustotheca clavata]